MAKRTGGEGPSDPASSLADKVKAVAEVGRGGAVWIRDDGAICFGDECVVFKPNGANLDIEVNPGACGPPGSELVQAIIESVGQGGETTFRVKPRLEQPGGQGEP